MNLHVTERYTERVQRLAAGVEPIDALRESRVVPPLFVAEETPLDQRRWMALARSGEDPFFSMARLSRRTTCRHVLLYREGLFDDADPRARIRLVEGGTRTGPRRFVPRRLSVPLMDPDDLAPDAPAGPQAAGFRIWRPHLFPGSAYPIHETATGVRGRVEQGGKVVRWARVEARNADGEIVGRAHGDDRGEFLLVLEAGAATSGDPKTTVDVTVTVIVPNVPPEPEATDLGRLKAEADPLWDLPIEELPESEETDPVSMGEVVPDGYATDRSWLLEGVPMGRITSYRDAFEIA